MIAESVRGSLHEVTGGYALVDLLRWRFGSLLWSHLLVRLLRRASMRGCVGSDVVRPHTFSGHQIVIHSWVNS